MKRPVPDKAEAAIDFPDRFYVGAFERGAQFEALANSCAKLARALKNKG